MSGDRDERGKYGAGKRVYDPDYHCGARSKRTGQPCMMRKGERTDHPGGGNCFLHFGRSPNGEAHGKRELRFSRAIASLADLTLSQIADRLARLAAAGAMSVDDPDHEDFLRAVNAFAKAAERAEGSKITLESKISFLAEVPDEELVAAHAEVQRLLAEARGE